MRKGGVTSWRLAAAFVITSVMGCGGSNLASGAPSDAGATHSATPTSAGASTEPAGNLVLIGRIVTMDDPPVAEALLIEGGKVAAVGTRVEVVRLAGDAAPVIDLGDSVAYPGFIDAHAHWIGDREYYGVGSAAEAIDAAVARGWTTISEQWVDSERLKELTTLAADGALPLRVDAYLALNYDREFLGDWYADREPGLVDERLSVRGLKIHLDDGAGKIVNWEPAELTAAIRRADEAGWQVSVHSMSVAAQDLVLDAFEAAVGPDGPNALHHRIEHAVQVTDEQLARMVAMDLGVVIHLDGEVDWIMNDHFLAEFDRADPPADIEAQVGRWRDFVNAGLHVASATDAPWTFPDLELTDDLGRPVDQIASGMDGRSRMVADPPSWLLDQTLSAEQSVRAVTLDAAWALGDETRRGHLAVGTLGDVTILSGDVNGATPDEIRAMDVLATIVGGAVVYCSDTPVCGHLQP